jgi:hypothetical protein
VALINHTPFLFVVQRQRIIGCLTGAQASSSDLQKHGIQAACKLTKSRAASQGNSALTVEQRVLLELNCVQPHPNHGAFAVSPLLRKVRDPAAADVQHLGTLCYGGTVKTCDRSSRPVVNVLDKPWLGVEDFIASLVVPFEIGIGVRPEPASI